MDLADHAADLYALPLDRFVAARNAIAREAMQCGDRELSADLRALPKPSSAAWLVNVLAARRRERLEEVLELGTSLREAQTSADRARLHALGQQRQHLLAAVAGESLEAAADLGYDVGAHTHAATEQCIVEARHDVDAAEVAVRTVDAVRAPADHDDAP